MEPENIARADPCQQRILRQAIASDAETRSHHVPVSRSHTDRFDHGTEIDAGPLGKPGPFLDKGNVGSPKAVLHELRGFRFDRAAQACRRKYCGVDELLQKEPTSLRGLVRRPRVDTALPRYGGEIAAPRRYALEAVGNENTVGIDRPRGEPRPQLRDGDQFCGPGRHRRLHDDKGSGMYVITDGADRLLEPFKLRLRRIEIEIRVQVDVNDDNIAFAKDCGIGRRGEIAQLPAAAYRLPQMGVRVHEWKPAGVDRLDTLLPLRIRQINAVNNEIGLAIPVSGLCQRRRHSGTNET